MGLVLAPWGVKGAVKIKPYGRNLWKFSAWWVGWPGKHQKIAVAECREHGGYLVARFEGCESPEAAKAYSGAQVGLERADSLETSAHEFLCRCNRLRGGEHPRRGSGAGEGIPFVAAR